MTILSETLQELLNDMGPYLDLLTSQAGKMNAGFELTDTGEQATLIFDEGITICEGLVDVAFKVTLTSELLEMAMNGEVDLFALAGRSHISEKKAVDFEFFDRSRMKEIFDTIYVLGTHFFVPGKIKSRVMRPELAGSAHGARPIPLVYWKDLRTAWYYIPAGEILNVAGEKDPYPQAFVVLSGKGRLIMENGEVDIEPSCTYYIPRNFTHRVHAEEDTTLIWIAYDAPMF